MRISFVLPPPDMSGGIRVVAIYAKQLMQRGHQVVLVAPARRQMGLKPRLKSLFMGKGRPHYIARHPSHFDSTGLDVRILERYRPPTDADVPNSDVVIATWWETAEWVNALSDRKGAKVYLIQHHEVFPYLPVDRVRATYRMPMQKIVIARWLQDVMRDEYSDPNAELISNAVDHQQFFALPRGKQSVPTVGFMYSPVAFKGVDITLRAIDSIRATFPNLRVLSFGTKVPDMDFSYNLDFHCSPPQDQLRHLYAQCDVWVTASRSEGFNLPAMEAMACRTPIVSTRTGWPAEAIITGQNGILAEVDDVQAIARGIEWTLSRPEHDWKNLSENAYKTVLPYSWETSADRLEHVLETACSPHPTTSPARG